MEDTLKLKNLSTGEKLRIMEIIWEDLTRTSEELESPDWHADALRETEKRFQAGQEQVWEWEEAKKALRKKFE